MPVWRFDQRTNRANIGGIASEVGVETRITVGDNLQRPSALMERQHIISDDLILKTDASSTLDAAFFIQKDQVDRFLLQKPKSNSV